MGEKRKNNPVWEQVKYRNKDGKMVTTYRKKGSAADAGAVKSGKFNPASSKQSASLPPVRLGLRGKITEGIETVGNQGLYEFTTTSKEYVQVVQRGDKEQALKLANKHIRGELDPQMVISGQGSMAVDKWSREFLANDDETEIQVKPFSNGREYGIMYRLRDTETGNVGSWVGMYEHRMADDIIVNASKFGEELEIGPYGRYGYRSRDYVARSRYGKYDEASSHMLRLLEDDYEKLGSMRLNGERNGSPDFVGWR